MRIFDSQVILTFFQALDIVHPKKKKKKKKKKEKKTREKK